GTDVVGARVLIHALAHSILGSEAVLVECLGGGFKYGLEVKHDYELLIPAAGPLRWSLRPRPSRSRPRIGGARFPSRGSSPDHSRRSPWIELRRVLVSGPNDAEARRNTQRRAGGICNQPRFRIPGRLRPLRY